MKIRGAILAIGLSMACFSPAPPTDTGYVGTWTRGSDRARSVISLVRDGDGYRFRIAMTTADDSREVRCTWDGHCSEMSQGVNVGDHVYNTHVDPDTGHVIVEAEIRKSADGTVVSRFVDELIVAPGGLQLDAYTLSRDGQAISPRDRPKRTFDKVSDEVVSPPPPTS